ncbi:ScbR family autoregulator-binding transcription factor [Streptomyces sp. WELS2]|uniref:ScbR family autoregulator-binding transcription factor n=1 Tax=Streptomyces sp. WELS2 TaxID=2749435 RepID=UPI0015EFEA32|nr:ScbR family autoregulator-binding transcription factor [Streptomyces sp. WELS2]
MTRQERAKRTKEMILRAAGSLFAERGYVGTTLYDVYTRAGVTKGAFYFHFPSKESLAEAVLASQMEGAAYPLVPRSLRLQELVDAGLAFACSIAEDPLLQGSIRLSLDLLDQGVGVDAKLPFRAWIKQNHEALEDAKAQGELKAHVNTEEVAELLVGGFSGVQLLSYAISGRRDLPERVSVLLAHVLASIATAGVLPRLDLSPRRGREVLAEAGRVAME